MRNLRRTVFVPAGILAALMLVATIIIGPQSAAVRASSHREAPLISNDPQADNTDLYAWVDQTDPTKVNLVANFIPFEHPDGAPNYYNFSDNVVYEINIDNVGDAKAHVTYQFKFKTTIEDTGTFLYPTGPITSLTDPNFNVRQTYSLVEIVTPISGAVKTTTLGSNLPVPPVNIGSKSTPNYDTVANAAIRTLTPAKLSGSGTDTIKVFAGQRDDPFWVDLGAIFDLLSLRPAPSPIGYSTGPTIGIDSVSGFNVHSLIIQVPSARLLSSQADPVIGVWSTAKRPTTRVLSSPAQVLTGASSGFSTESGALVQVSRLGMPLTNEVVLPLGLKDAYNGLDPSLDQSLYLASASSSPPFNTQPFIDAGNLLEKSVMNPELGRLLCGLYGVPLPRAGTGVNKCNTLYTDNNPATGRSDLFQIFLQGIKLATQFEITTGTGAKTTLPVGFVVNRHSKGTDGNGAGIVASDQLRLNTALLPGGACSKTPNYALGLLGGDACGFPNGRRLQDDATRIELLAVGGAAFSVTTGVNYSLSPSAIAVLTDGTTKNDKPFLTTFPYVASPHQGQEWDHQSLVRKYLASLTNKFGGTSNVQIPR